MDNNSSLNLSKSDINQNFSDIIKDNKDLYLSYFQNSNNDSKIDEKIDNISQNSKLFKNTQMGNLNSSNQSQNGDSNRIENNIYNMGNNQNNDDNSLRSQQLSITNTNSKEYVLYNQSSDDKRNNSKVYSQIKKGCVGFVREFQVNVINLIEALEDGENGLQLLAEKEIDAFENPVEYSKFFFTIILSVKAKFNIKKKIYKFKIFYSNNESSKEYPIDFSNIKDTYFSIKKMKHLSHAFTFCDLIENEENEPKDLLSLLEAEELGKKDEYKKPIDNIKSLVSYFEKTLGKSGKTYKLIGELLFEIDYCEEAVLYFKKSLNEINIEDSKDENALVEDPLVYNYIGRCYHFNIGKSSNIELSLKAVDYFTKAIELDPNYNKAYNNLGCAYLIAQDYQKARENFQKSVDLEPTNARAQCNLGCVIEENFNDPEGAKPYYEKSIQEFERGVNTVIFHQNHSIAYNKRGYIYETLDKNYIKALQFYQKAVKLDSNNKDAKSNLTRLKRLITFWIIMLILW